MLSFEIHENDRVHRPMIVPSASLIPKIQYTLQKESDALLFILPILLPSRS